MKSMRFYVNSSEPDENTIFPICMLRKSYWNDKGFVTGYNLSYIKNFDDFLNDEEFHIGLTKIGQMGMKHNNNLAYLKDEVYTNIPENVFEELEETYFSLGQSETFYERVIELGEDISHEILRGLRDIVFNLDIFRKVQNERVMIDSLQREVSVLTVKGQFRRILTGEAKLTPFKFEYYPKYSCVGAMNFFIEPNSLPPSNIQVIIGKNGVGKTYLLRDMLENIVFDTEKTEGEGYFVEDELSIEETFSSVIAMSFSAFDNTLMKNGENISKNKIPFHFVGLEKNKVLNEIKNILNDQNKIENQKNIDILQSIQNELKNQDDMDELAEYFLDSLKNVRNNNFKYIQWKDSIRILEEDSTFESLNIIEVAEEYESDEKRIKKYFDRRLSSGHKIVLLIITKLSEFTEEKSLILFDEPENHLHPPLLSLLFKAMNKIFVYRNAVAIVTTHSPVVLQEVPKECTWILNRIEKQLSFRRPRIETYGENTGILNREVFELDAINSGYHRLIKESIESNDSTEDVYKKFDKKLGSEAKELVKAYLYKNDEGNKI